MKTYILIPAELELIKVALECADRNLTEEGYKPVPSIKAALKIIKEKLS